LKKIYLGERIKIAVLSILVFIFTLEVSARIDDRIKYDAPIFSQYSAALLRTADSEGINCNIPHAHFEKWKINRLGFRGPEISLTKEKERVRIVCLGTSETFGLYEGPGEDWVSQLLKILGENRRLEVVNASVVGLPLKKYRRYIEKYVLRLDPDVVILYINPFDYGVGTENFAKRQRGQGEVAKSNKGGWKNGLADIFSRVRILAKIKQAVKRIMPENILKWYQHRDLRKQIGVLEHNRLNGAKALDVIPPENLRSFRRDLEELIRFLLDQNIKIILSSYPVLISPENLDRYPEIFLDHRRFYIELSLQGIIDASQKFNEAIKAVAGEHKIDLVDNNAMIPKNTQYFADNVHYTDAGARLVALNVADYIRKRWLIDG